MDKRRYGYLSIWICFYSSWLAAYGKLLFSEEIGYYVSPFMNGFSWSLFGFLVISAGLFLSDLFGGKISVFKKEQIIYFLPLGFLLFTEGTPLGGAGMDRKIRAMMPEARHPGGNSENSIEALREDSFRMGDPSERDTPLPNTTSSLGKDSNPIKTFPPSGTPESPKPFPSKGAIELVSGKEFYTHLTALYGVRQTQYIGKSLRIKGMYYFNPTYSERSLIGRYVMTCCAADSQLLGFLAEFEVRPSIENGIWIEAIGVLAGFEKLDLPYPLIKIKSYRTTTAPGDPYIFPYLYLSK